MEIKVLGSGCSKCLSTIGIIERAARDLGLAVQITKVQDHDEIRRYGVQATPAVVIHGRVVHSGGLPSREQVQAWLEPRTDRLAGPADAAPVLHRQGRRRQDLAVHRRGAEPGRRRQEGAAGQHRRGVEPRRDAGHRTAQHAHARARRAGSVGPEHRPRHGRRGLPAARARADGRRRQRSRTIDRARATVRRLHHRDRLLRRVRQPLVRRCRELRPHRLRHGADRAHLAPAQPAQGLERVSRRQRSRRLLPGAALGLEDAGSALQGRARRPERSGPDHGDPGDAAGQERHRRGGAHVGGTACAGLEQPAPGDQRRVPRQRAHRRGGLRHRGTGAAGAAADADVAGRLAAGSGAAAAFRHRRPAGACDRCSARTAIRTGARPFVAEAERTPCRAWTRWPTNWPPPDTG